MWLWRALVAVAAGKWVFEAYIARQQDFFVYLDAARRLIAGASLYGPLEALPYTYPPLTAALFVPLAWLPDTVAGALWLTLNLTVSWWIIRRLAPGLPRIMLLLLLLGAPFSRSIYLGQINVLLFLLMWLAASAPVAASAGGWRIGVAAALKITPAWLGASYALTGRWKALAVAALTALVGLGLGWLIAPDDSAWYWLHGIWDVNRVGGGGYPDNQSLWGLLARLGAHTPAAVSWSLGACILAATLVATYRHRREPLEVFTAVGLGGLILAPVAWSHHFFWLSVAVASLWKRRPGAARLLAVLMLFEPIFMDGLLRHAPSTIRALGVSNYTVLACCLLGAMCLRGHLMDDNRSPQPADPLAADQTGKSTPAGEPRTSSPPRDDSTSSAAPELLRRDGHNSHALKAAPRD